MKMIISNIHFIQCPELKFSTSLAKENERVFIFINLAFFCNHSLLLPCFSWLLFWDYHYYFVWWISHQMDWSVEWKQFHVYFHFNFHFLFIVMKGLFVSTFFIALLYWLGWARSVDWMYNHYYRKTKFYFFIDANCAM